MPSIVGWVAFQFHMGSNSDNVMGGTGSEVTGFTPEGVPISTPVTLDAAKMGWFATGRTFSEKSVKYTPEGKAQQTIPSTSWGQVREIQYGVVREYGGVNSSGGPQQSGRADHRLITMQRNIDQVTPYLFKHCCNGFQIRRLAFLDSTETLGNIIVVAENCQVVSLNTSETRFFKDTRRYNLQIHGQAPNMSLAGSGADESTFLGATRVESVSILYTKLSIKVANSDWQGWDTGTEQAWNTPGYVVT
ncbi:type VI secretion system tube protein Hcp [Rubinisphaera sp.]|uniref:type VI secretion system tube protein Hcp n=1 Tax=Rubinisphaera sp. TaxID=2024857 RepID=UPI000C0C917D|nr:type VI secretion system tube protein Hcp [Rubinisphaera sp.]MBV12236.1 hypothetical protein [Rubinisphaera sp.]HCS54995.1 hypothetical protein [Planctomycetaceae bacterium]|tara:strand:+ start:682 stop:1422 length:741 start_codon:yes stop_codon:yes gene_type:complete